MTVSSRLHEYGERAAIGCAAVLVLLAGLACSGGGQPSSPSDRMPTNSGSELRDPGRIDPWGRLAEFERTIRSGLPDDDRFNYAENYSGRYALLYPKYIRREAAWTYVILGRDFASHGEWAAAARADWAALMLVRKTVASRPDRELIRRDAYRDLATVATARHQKEWAALLTLCANMIDTYLATPKAKDDQEVFSRLLRKVEQAEQEQRNAEAAADRAAVLGAISTGLQMGSGYAAAHGNLQATLNVSIQGLQQSLELGNSLGAQADELRALEAGRGDFLRQFDAVVADDVTEIESGLSFVAREVTFFLLGTPDRAPYLDAIKRWATDKPKVLARVADAGASPEPAKVLALARALQKLEIHAARYERRGITPPAEVETDDDEDHARATEPSTEELIGSLYEITDASEPEGRTYAGTLEIEHHDPVLHLRWDLGASGRVTGVGLVQGRQLCAGWSSNSRDVGISVYGVESSQLVGRWATLNSESALGQETLQGPADTLAGAFNIASGTIPGGAKTYGGSVQIAPVNGAFEVRWTIEGNTYRGTGLKKDGLFAAGWAPGTAGAGITVYDVSVGQLSGVWSPPAGGGVGHETLRRVR